MEKEKLSMEERKLFDKLDNIYKDKQNGKLYWLNTDAYKKAINLPKPLRIKDICTKLELVTGKGSDEALKKRIERFGNHINGCKDASKSNIEFVRQLGLALSGKEDAFLVPVSSDLLENFAIDAKIGANVSDVNEIYNQLNRMLYLLEISCYYNYVPNTKKAGKQFFDDLVKDVKIKIDSCFMNKPVARKQFYQLANEIEYIINECDAPGVPQSWITANPNIKYYDCVYDMIEKYPDLYIDIKERDVVGSGIKFKFYPSTKDVIARQTYFNEKGCKNPTISYERLYQEELVETFNIRLNQCIDTIKNELNK